MSHPRTGKSYRYVCTVGRNVHKRRSADAAFQFRNLNRSIVSESRRGEEQNRGSSVLAAMAGSSPVGLHFWSKPDGQYNLWEAALRGEVSSVPHRRCASEADGDRVDEGSTSCSDS